MLSDGITLIMAVDRRFDVTVPNAYQTTRLGYIRGFAAQGVPGRLVPHCDLARVAAEVENPIIWLTYDDYNYINKEQLGVIRQHPHIVWVNSWFDGMEKVHEDANAPSPAIPEHTLRRILDSGASFLWCTAPEPYFGSYENWIRAGQKVVSLPLACDADRYYPTDDTKFSDVEVAFVGGYRAYKEPQYHAYLWPWEDKLKVWGYSEWPRCYQGQLSIEDEKTLYKNAKLSPTISEPQFSVTGDTVERPLKVLGSGGLTILDCVPAYRCLFGPDEALMPDSIEEYYQMANAVLTDPEVNFSYRAAGYKAVMERHTYAHRAQKIMEELGIWN